jgi:hypothetical protein
VQQGEAALNSTATNSGPVPEVEVQQHCSSSRSRSATAPFQKPDEYGEHTIAADLHWTDATGCVTTNNATFKAVLV